MIVILFIVISCKQTEKMFKILCDDPEDNQYSSAIDIEISSQSYDLIEHKQPIFQPDIKKKRLVPENSDSIVSNTKRAKVDEEQEKKDDDE